MAAALAAAAAPPGAVARGLLLRRGAPRPGAPPLGRRCRAPPPPSPASGARGAACSAASASRPGGLAGAAPPRPRRAEQLAGAWRVGGVRRAAVHEVLANGDIPFPRVRVVDDRGLVGDFLLGEARALAEQRGVDLVVLSGAVEPPLCRLVSLDAFIDELDRKATALDGARRQRQLREFSFDPGLKVKGLRFSAVIDEHHLERKVNQARQFLEKGHRVEARVLQGRCPPEDVVDLALRIIAEVRDLAKPEYLEESVREYKVSVNSPKSLVRSGKAPPHEMRLRLWPCTPEQAAAFQLPAHIVGPRRRRGPRIVGIDEEDPEDAWKWNRKPHPGLRGFGKRDLWREVFDE